MASCQPSSPKSAEHEESDDIKGSEDVHHDAPPFTESTVQEMSASLGFEAEFVRMALVQSLGDVTLAAEILFQIKEKTQGAIRKMERRHKRKKKKEESAASHCDAVRIRTLSLSLSVFFSLNQCH